jgi:hypothetical protein
MKFCDWSSDVCSSDLKTISKDEHYIPDIQGIDLDQRHSQHQDAKLITTQAVGAFCAVRLPYLGNGAGAHDQ